MCVAPEVHCSDECLQTWCIVYERGRTKRGSGRQPRQILFPHSKSQQTLPRRCLRIEMLLPRAWPGLDLMPNGLVSPRPEPCPWLVAAASLPACILTSASLLFFFLLLMSQSFLLLQTLRFTPSNFARPCSFRLAFLPFLLLSLLAAPVEAARHFSVSKHR